MSENSMDFDKMNLANLQYEDIFSDVMFFSQNEELVESAEMNKMNDTCEVQANPPDDGGKFCFNFCR